MSNIVQRYDRNLRGRDFVVGDIHGCFDKLRQALDDVDFHPETDRLFSVGDLIDRGPQSIESLDWLANPWFHACLGNHEAMVLQSAHDDVILQGWMWIVGGDWWFELDTEARTTYLSAFRQLPMAMEIATTQGRVGIVHADIPGTLTWQEFLHALESGDETAREIALWSRRRAEGIVKTQVAGIDRVVCGHTITANHQVQLNENVWFIDTGAFLFGKQGGHLTLLTLDSLFQHSEASMVSTDERP
jgi:serine/threonine protein phosphatase 1